MFAIILPGRPCQTEMATISPTQFAFTFPSHPHFNHIVVFILPGNTLPPDAAAGVYIQLPGQPSFKFLGALANEKQSAIFKVTLPNTNIGPQEINLGISVESVANIQAQMQQLQAEQPASSSMGSSSKVSTKVLAQRIIKNAFNFLAGFSGSAGGTEVVPLKSFQDWWTKFERKIEMDPSFLERDVD